MKKRIEFLDIARGLSLLLIMISHSCGFAYGGIFITSYYIPLFFFVSGYLMYQKNINLKERLKRFLYPYFIYTIILSVIYSIFSIFNNNFSAHDIFKRIFMSFYSRNAFYYPYNRVPNVHFFQLWNGPMWYLTSASVATIIYYSLIKQKKKNYMKCFSLCLFVTVLFTFCPILLPWSIDTAFLCAAFMLGGTICASSSLLEKRKNLKFYFILSIFLLIYIHLVHYNSGINLSVRDYGSHFIFSCFLTFIIGIVGSIICLMVSKIIEQTWFSKIFIWINKNAMSILCLHYMIFSIYDKLILSGNQYGNGIIKIIIALVICPFLKKIICKISIIPEYWKKYI